MEAVCINKEISYYDETTESTYYLTDFICDNESDVDTANAVDSKYLLHPSGSTIYCIENGKVYMLKADKSEYVEVA